MSWYLTPTGSAALIAVELALLAALGGWWAVVLWVLLALGTCVVLTAFWAGWH